MYRRPRSMLSWRMTYYYRQYRLHSSELIPDFCCIASFCLKYEISDFHIHQFCRNILDIILTYANILLDSPTFVIFRPAWCSHLLRQLAYAFAESWNGFECLMPYYEIFHAIQCYTDYFTPYFHYSSLLDAWASRCWLLLFQVASTV